MNRRSFVTGSSLLTVSAASPFALSAQEPAVFKYQDAAARRELAKLEKRIGGRLGVALTDAKGDIALDHRGDERFAMCSTFKAPLAFALFDAADKGRVDVKKSFAVTENDLVPYAPFVEEQIAAKKMVTLEQLAKATVKSSDNAAANLILKAIGGPEAFTDFVRRRGDVITRLDRIEPFLNENKVGDPRDTTSPIAFAKLMHGMMSGKSRLTNWSIVYDAMASSKTGLGRIRLGLPYGWPVGNKTGTAGGGLAYNDVAIFWPSFAGYEGDEPRFLTVYTDRPTASAAIVDRTIAEVAKIAAWIAPRLNRS
ncbi:class A beta-lactamase [Sphingorhabdus sp. EL138]|uniref:class A beta-lactamase n=1 Tax=Sphingorhabdus sp. EL138 TaxID=2073156 RepID=UPI000D68C483|nr:class A beta-lactamase [Sphingorhabdus sp. EL138]